MSQRERESYAPRATDIVRRTFLKSHGERVRRLQGDCSSEPNILPVGWRNWTLYDLSKCPHTTCSFFEVENEHGIWGMEICVNCGVQVRRECPHVSNTWNQDGSVLTCDNCGIDGT